MRPTFQLGAACDVPGGRTGRPSGWLACLPQSVNRLLTDRLQIGVLKNKWYIDELYSDAAHQAFDLVRRPGRLSDCSTRHIIDGFLHLFGKVTAAVGSGLRNGFDKPVVNAFFGDGTASVIQGTGRNLRSMQTGRIQQYMLASLVIMILVAGLAFYLMGRSDADVEHRDARRGRESRAGPRRQTGARNALHRYSSAEPDPLHSRGRGGIAPALAARHDRLACIRWAALLVKPHPVRRFGVRMAALRRQCGRLPI